MPGWGTSTGAGGGSWISGWLGSGASCGPCGSVTPGWPGLGMTGSGVIGVFGLPGMFCMSNSLAHRITIMFTSEIVTT